MHGRSALGAGHGVGPKRKEGWNMQRRVDCCPECLTPQRAHSYVIRAPAVIMFFDCSCGCSWKTSYALAVLCGWDSWIC